MLTALGGGVRRTAYRGLANVRWTEGRPKTSVRQPSALTVVKASRCDATKSCTVIGGLPVSSAMILSSPEKMRLL